MNPSSKSNASHTEAAAPQRCIFELPSRSRESIGWVDIMRVSAAVLVVLSHCCDPFVACFENDETSFFTGVFVGSLTRPCVPLFVMMTAVLLWPTDKFTLQVGTFYKKRIGRLMWPLAFWSIVPPICFWAYFSATGTAPDNPCLPADITSTGRMMRSLYSWLFNFNTVTTPLWYLYMLIGLYLVMPIVGTWLNTATRHEVATVLKVWLITLFIPYLELILPQLQIVSDGGLWGQCSWNIYTTFYYASGFIGYMLCAYYFTKWPLGWSMTKTAAVCVPLMVAGYAITSFGYIEFNTIWPHDYYRLEKIWWFCGINVVLQTVPLFVLASRIRVRPRRWLTALAILSFGVYLCHFFLVYVTYDWFNIAALHPAVRILLMTITTFTLASAVALLCWNIRPLRRFVA